MAKLTSLEEILSDQLGIATRLAGALIRGRARIDSVDIKTPARYERRRPPPWSGDNTVTLRIEAVDSWIDNPGRYPVHPASLMADIERLTSTLLTFGSADFAFAEKMMLLWGVEAERIQKAGG